MPFVHEGAAARRGFLPLLPSRPVGATALESPVMMTPLIRVAIVEPQSIFRECLSLVFRRSARIEVATDVADPATDVAVVGTSVLGVAAVHSLLRLREQNARLKLCTLVQPGNDWSTSMAHRLRSEGIASVHAAPSDIVDAVLAVARGETVIGPGLAPAPAPQSAKRGKRSGAGLSRREIEVMRLIVDGLSNKQISRELVLSERTVKNHVSNIYSKLNVTARTAAAVHAYRHGIGN